MIDCPDVEIRELLPEYLNGTLGEARRAAVEAHLASCPECRAELTTIRLVREAYGATKVRVDVPSIVAALPRPSRIRAVPKPVRRSWVRSHAFQLAAAISFVALGGVSLTVARSFFGGETPVDSALVSTRGTGAATEVLPAISFAGGVSDLGDDELETLLNSIESIEALPVAEPATVLIGEVPERQGT